MLHRSAMAIPVIMFVVVAGVVAAAWLGLMADVLGEVVEPSIAGPGFGRDFAGFQLAGERAASGHGADLYVFDAAGFVETRDPAQFKNPPFYALAMVPFSSLGFRAGYAIWTVLGLCGLGFGFVLLGVRFPLRWVTATLFTMAGILTVFYGQNTFFTFLLFSASYASLRSGHQVLGGVFIGAAGYKPQLLGGFVVWLIARYRMMWKVIAGAVLSFGVLVAASVVLIPQSWLGFFDIVLTSEPDLPAATSHLSLRYTALLLLPRHPTAVLLVYAVLVAASFAGQLWFLRRVRGDLNLEFAAAVSISVLVAPHALTYEWVLLAIPLALVWNRRPDLWRTWMWSAVALSTAALLSVYLAKWQVGEFGSALQIGPFVLMGVLVVDARRLVDDWKGISGDDRAAMNSDA